MTIVFIFGILECYGIVGNVTNNSRATHRFVCVISIYLIIIDPYIGKTFAGHINI